ncbi:MAG: S8 family serine peptidase [Planctomycetota bacterium]
MNKAVLLGLSLTVVLVTTLAAPAAVPPAAGEYVANEIVVKFNQGVADSVEGQLQHEGSVGELSLSPALNRLNAKYRVRKIKPVFKNFRQRRQRLEALRQKDEALLTKKEKHILGRLKRAAKGAKVPELNRIYKLELQVEEGQSLEEVVAAYNNDSDVEYAELNYIVSICNSPNDPLYPLQWPLNNIGQDYPESGWFGLPLGTPDRDIDAPEAWDRNTGTSDVILAVVDTGVDYTHRDMDDNMWVNEAELNGQAGVDDDENGYVDDIYGYDFVNGDSDPKDDHGHGTHCSGIIAAEGDNGLDIAGVCWDARIMALKFLGSGGGGNVAAATEALYYAVENGADIISNSWGSGFPFVTIEEAIDYACSQGAVVVAAAGNGNSESEFYPAYYDGVIAVAATDSDDQRASFSNYGDWVDIAAPGVDILSLRADVTSMGMVYDEFTTVAWGTSMACPHVAGACALLLSIAPETSADKLQNSLMETADPLAAGICVSGRLNVYGAMLRALGPQGAVWLDSDVYSCSDSIEIKVFDTDLNSNGTQQVTVSTDDGDFEMVLLTETSPTLGIFAGSISTSSGYPSIEDGQLQLSHDQIITATYYDTNDGTGGAATVTDTAVGDCEEPVIFNVEIDVPGPAPTITFETEEPTTARVLYSQACGDPNYSVATGVFPTTSHMIQLSDVSPETNHFFIIEANDAVGNHTVDNNTGWCYAFTTDGPGDIYVPAQYYTIQEAIDHSWNSGSVWAADDRYTGEGNRDIDFRGKAIIVRSENGPENCIIDCEGTKEDPHRGFYFHSGEDSNSILSGFTITNGYAFGSSYQDRSGGAIRCGNSSPMVANCIITGNAGNWDAGGIFNYYSSPTVSKCTFIKNWAVANDGGAISNEYSSPTITNCKFVGNSAYDWGGAIRNIFRCEPTITNCIISGNSADGGGGMFYWFRCEPTVINCTFAGNSARNGNALGCDSGGQNYPGSIELFNCILANGGSEIWNNDDSTITIAYSDVCGGYAGDGNTDADPCFVSLGYWADVNDSNTVVEPNDPNAVWVEGDYRLLAGSPCIDAGDNNGVPADTADLDGDGNTTESIPFDLDGNPRIVDGNSDGNAVVDMGAYEFSIPPIEVSMKVTPQAFNPGSQGNWVKAHFVLPEGFSVEDVDTDSPAKIVEPFEPDIQSDHINVFVNDDGLVEIEAAFPRAGFCGVGIDGNSVEVTVLGTLTSGQQFYGTDTIKIIDHHFECLADFASYWLQTDCGKPDWCGGADLNEDSVANFLDFALFDACCIEIITE